VNGPASPVRAWTFGAGSPIISGPIIAADGTILIGTENARIIAVTPAGTQQWAFQLTEGGPPTYPLINSKGQVVVGARGGFVQGIKLSDGKEAWKSDLDSAPYSDGRVPLRGHPVIAPNYPNVLIGADNYNVYELEEDGGYRSVRRAEGPVRAGPAITPDGTIVWAGGDPAVYGGHAAGGDKWRIGLDGQTSAALVAAPDNTTYVATEAGSLFAIKSDGTPRWGFEAPDKPRWKVRVGDGRPIKASPALSADGTLYVGAEDGKLYAVDAATGAGKWSFATGAAITSSPTVGANGLIYVGSIDSRLYVVTPDGQQQASFQTDGAIDVSSAAIAPDGTLYIGTRVGTLYALREGGPVPTVAPAATPTPQLAAAVPTPVPTLAPTPVPTVPTVSPLPLPADPVPARADARYFSETGHNVRGPFLSYFETRGGAAQFGYPRTEELTEDGKTVQYFQRARFELYPGLAGTPFEVQLQLTGDLLTAARRPFPTAVAIESTDDVRYYPEVGHTLRNAFLRYFDANGGLERFGYPISEELLEGNNDGTGRSYTVQYFQRARLEYHPELAGASDEIQLGLLGDQVLRNRGWLR
jgi:hypothetical protein